MISLVLGYVWRDFWERHTAGQFPPPPLPDVRFPQEMVVVLLLGRQDSGGGPFIEFLDVSNTLDRGGSFYLVDVREDRTPGPLDVVTNPYHIVKLPRLKGVLSFLHKTP